MRSDNSAIISLRDFWTKVISFDSKLLPSHRSESKRRRVMIIIKVDAIASSDCLMNGWEISRYFHHTWHILNTPCGKRSLFKSENVQSDLLLQWKVPLPSERSYYALFFYLSKLTKQPEITFKRLSREIVCNFREERSWNDLGKAPKHFREHLKKERWIFVKSLRLSFSMRKRQYAYGLCHAGKYSETTVNYEIGYPFLHILPEKMSDFS